MDFEFVFFLGLGTLTGFLWSIIVVQPIQEPI